jgi:hypothetical protein
MFAVWSPGRSSGTGLNLSNGRQMFSAEEDARLKQLVSQHGSKDWKNIAKKMPNRSTRQCRERYKNYLSPELINLPWSASEDDLLRQKFDVFGPKWATIAHFFTGRSDVSLKNHWASLISRGASARSEAANPSPASCDSPPRAQTELMPPIRAVVPQDFSEPLPPFKVPPAAPAFRISQMLWSTAEPSARQRVEVTIENERLKETFPNYGGKIW